MTKLREFSWRYFTLTGDIDAYLLYKTHVQLVQDKNAFEQDTTTGVPHPSAVILDLV
ncbi:YqzL family protein [Alicyclobacillaceae bacterium I2511]|nr:YqzL family protein [Alicyclobacillaceae bacterium I2511]